MIEPETRQHAMEHEPAGGDPPCWAHMYESPITPGMRVRRVYDPPTADDGRRILVDRIWPRGLSRQEAVIELWAKNVAPSPELRRWFGHDPARWQEFARRYRRELQARPESWRPLLEAAVAGPMTLVYGARDEEHNQAVVLRQFLEERLAPY